MNGWGGGGGVTPQPSRELLVAVCFVGFVVVLFLFFVCGFFFNRLRLTNTAAGLIFTHTHTHTSKWNLFSQVVFLCLLLLFLVLFYVFFVLWIGFFGCLFWGSGGNEGLCYLFFGVIVLLLFFVDILVGVVFFILFCWLLLFYFVCYCFVCCCLVLGCFWGGFFCVS